MNHDIAHASALPFSTDSLDGLAARIATGATIVGIGGSTRFSREVSGLQDQLFRRLVTQHGFRLLALQEHAGAVDRLDRYVRTGEGSAESALDASWRPWRTAETAAALRWIRAFNRDHPDDQVRIVGTKPAQVQHEDYDAVLGHVRAVAPDRLPELTAHLEPIRTAHDLDEHVQRAQGVHPGRPFAEHARDALALLKSLPTAEGSEAVLARMRLIVDFHEQSVAGRGSFGGGDDVAADALAGHQRRTGLRMVFWDGIAHTSAAPFRLGMVSDGALMPSVGSELRARYGAGYVAVAIGFHHGDLGVVTVPEPPADFLDTELGRADTPAHWLDLRGEHGEDVHRRWAGPAKMRVISGVYDPAQDADAYLSVASLTAAFDVLAHVHEARAAHWLEGVQY
ncbi:erythromycin esterase family protein [Streptomyces inhibens]|uniref:erythromycin esterase family protein n=1 Tax=Streptomyces inhibens TaxID=2293571 RepID=UPI001EE70158|nr:erythromycin esterase family protein [Streptomyces inhibens]UKY54923.1 erythromycin esterase family protein [Streptomyces inhibens]